MVELELAQVELVVVQAQQVVVVVVEEVTACWNQAFELPVDLLLVQEYVWGCSCALL